YVVSGAGAVVSPAESRAAEGAERSATMSVSSDMMKDLPMSDTSVMSGMDMTAMQNCIDACSACMQACTMCSDSMSGMEGMGTCAALCANCADMCGTMMRMMLRPTGMERDSMMAALEACIAMCRVCRDECTTHMSMSETCAMCAAACDACMTACEDMMSALRAPSTDS
ncbi:MAG: uncharacterized protein JWR33_2493, partial [Naasia sp.]|nr:uncharacterized protein [Naasia sp.]